MAGPVVGGGIGTILLAIVVTLLGGDPSVILQQAAPAGGGNTEVGSPESERQVEFVKVVLADTEDVWSELFRESGARYRDAGLVLFSGRDQSACGIAQRAAGPFYCPLDQKVYLDLSFFKDLSTEMQAPGDFAQAYVVAHEIGHHVQNQMGVLEQIQGLQRRVSKTQSNQLSVRLELQADCFAGVWAKRSQARQNNIVLEQGDLEEGLRAASSVGDDRLQMQAQGYVVPDSFNHGSSEQRMRWFRQGVKTGDPGQCDTFNAAKI
jgi:uncharacterized protein